MEFKNQSMNKHEPDIKINIKQSKRLLGFLILVHFVAFIACFINALPAWVNAIIALTIGVHLFYYYKQFYQEQSNYKLLYSTVTGWRIVRQNKEAEIITIQADTVINKYIVILHYKNQSGRSCRLLIFKDTLTSPEFSQLAVKIKLSQINC